MNLKDLMQSEYEAMASMEIPMPDAFERAMAFIRTKLTKREFMDVESAIYSGCIDSEHKAFEQGFVRGIVVVKGGAI
jgi:uroporphyrinogen-III decarboxylase